MFRVTGLDTKLVQRSHKNLDPSKLSLLRAPQTGSFFSASSQANFDCICAFCKDSQFHWLSCPRYAHLRADVPGISVGLLWKLPILITRIDAGPCHEGWPWPFSINRAPYHNGWPWRFSQGLTLALVTKAGPEACVQGWPCGWLTPLSQGKSTFVCHKGLAHTTLVVRRGYLCHKGLAHITLSTRGPHRKQLFAPIPAWLRALISPFPAGLGGLLKWFFRPRPFPFLPFWSLWRRRWCSAETWRQVSSLGIQKAPRI